MTVPPLCGLSRVEPCTAAVTICSRVRSTICSSVSFGGGDANKATGSECRRAGDTLVSGVV